MSKKRRSHSRKISERIEAITQEPLPALTTTPNLSPMDTDVMLYLTDDRATDAPVIVALVPPDLSRCQCEWADSTQPTFGPKPIVRCENPPTVVAFQKRTQGETAPTGAMALCDDHRVLVEHMYPGQCYYRAVTHNQKIGEYVG